MRLNTAIRKFRWPTANGESYDRTPSRLPMPNASLSHRHDATRGRPSEQHDLCRNASETAVSQDVWRNNRHIHTL